MKQTDFFFSSVVDLKDHHLPKYAKDAMYTIYSACRAINQPNKYGPSVNVIQIDAILQDYDSRFFKPSIRYYRKKKTISAGVKVALDKLMKADFPGTVQLYLDVIYHVLDKVKDRVDDFDFDRVKKDLTAAVRAEMEVAG